MSDSALADCYGSVEVLSAKNLRDSNGYWGKVETHRSFRNRNMLYLKPVINSEKVNKEFEIVC